MLTICFVLGCFLSCIADGRILRRHASGCAATSALPKHNADRGGSEGVCGLPRGELEDPFVSMHVCVCGGGGGGYVCMHV